MSAHILQIELELKQKDGKDNARIVVVQSRANKATKEGRRHEQRR